MFSALKQCSSMKSIPKVCLLIFRSVTQSQRICYFISCRSRMRWVSFVVFLLPQPEMLLGTLTAGSGPIIGCAAPTLPDRLLSRCHLFHCVQGSRETQQSSLFNMFWYSRVLTTLSCSVKLYGKTSVCAYTFAAFF